MSRERTAPTWRQLMDVLAVRYAAAVRAGDAEGASTVLGIQARLMGVES